MNIYVLLSMFFLHVVADFNLQGILADFKQKDWWQEHCSGVKYRYDFVISLIIHAFSWTFMVFIPIVVVLGFSCDMKYLIVFVANVAVHSLVDSAKANTHKINLVQDQLLHLAQIVFTWYIFIA